MSSVVHELAGRLLGLPRVGLAAVVEHYLGLSLAKEHSAVDWSTRPLPEPWLRYAALDVEVLVELRDRLEAEIRRRIEGTRVHGAGGPRVANTLNLGFDGVEKSGLVMALDLDGFAVSAGSACSSGVPTPSRVLMAMGLSEAQAQAAIRVSLSAHNTWEELESFVGALEGRVARMRKTEA